MELHNVIALSLAGAAIALYGMFVLGYYFGHKKGTRKGTAISRLVRELDGDDVRRNGVND